MLFIYSPNENLLYVCKVEGLANLICSSPNKFYGEGLTGASLFYTKEKLLCLWY
jgi:hypothetical protein